MKIEYSRSDIKIKGTYMHFKGNKYLVETIAKDCETLEDVVVYRQLYGDQTRLWVRKLQNFLEEIPERKDNVTGQKHRFELVK